MLYYLLIVSWAANRRIFLFSSIEKANKLLENTFGDYRTYFETPTQEGVKTTFEIEHYVEGKGWFYSRIIEVRLDEVTFPIMEV